MQNGASKETASAPAPNITADFLTGSTEIGLDRIRTRLLDLTNRNKLLNFRHSPASSMRVVDVPIDTVFRQLRDMEKLAFMPVPEPDVAGGEAPPAKDYAEELGWNTSILKNLGWKIHRVWSTDWFKNRDAEIKRMLRYIEGLLENDPAYTLERLKVSKAEALRRRLVTLRDTEITPAFPDAPTEKSLLRDDLLEAFLEKRPKTRDEWFRRIPQHMRSGVDSKQVGKYLDRVLGIIGEHE